MVTAGDFKNGLTIQFENNIYQIIEFQHVKPGKGAAFVRCKLKISRTVELLRKHSVQQRNLKTLISNVKKCSICTMMENYSTSWITKHLIRSH